VIRKCGFSGLVASVGILFSACVFAPPGYAAGENKLTIAMLNSATQTPYYVAVESGLYKHYGLEVVPVQFSGGDY
jgi:ABC-type nitrate/sulfonate/bicarbonate transport system substrate-binding protein